MRIHSSRRGDFRSQGMHAVRLKAPDIMAVTPRALGSGRCRPKCVRRARLAHPTGTTLPYRPSESKALMSSRKIPGLGYYVLHIEQQAAPWISG